MKFSVRIKRSAARELHRISPVDRPRVVAAIDSLATEPYRGTALKGDLRGLRRLRVGDYRIVYEIQQQVLVVLIVRVANRGTVYRHR